MLYTVDKVAKMLDMHPRTVRRYIEKGQLRAERIGGSWRISEEAFAELFNAPETKEAITKHIDEKSENMLEQYLKGKHRLQKDNLVMMYVFVFNPQEEAWVFAKLSDMVMELNRLGQTEVFDYTMSGSEQGLCRLTLVATSTVLQAIIKELERLRVVN